jgi:5-methylcytosine-specific restriction endonuclease McrA
VMQLISRKEAANKGLKHYYTGQPCVYGHVSLRLVSSKVCMECAKIKTKNYRAKNIEVCRDKDRARYQQNKTYYLDKNKRFLETNPEYFHNYNTSVKGKQAKLKWTALNPEKYEENYLKQNATLKARARKSLCKAKRKGVEKLSQVNFEKLWEDSCGLCYLCGLAMVSGEEHYDHIIPLSRNGTHLDVNIKPTHARCNLVKNNKTPEEFFEYIKFKDEVITNALCTP